MSFKSDLTQFRFGPIAIASKNGIKKGNMSLLNGDVNMREKTRDESLKINRDVVGNMPYAPPDISNMGQVAGHQQKLPSSVESERNQLNFNDQLKENPYVVNYKTGL